jgi:hypothetical protein
MVVEYVGEHKRPTNANSQCTLVIMLNTTDGEPVQDLQWIFEDVDMMARQWSGGSKTREMSKVVGVQKWYKGYYYTLILLNRKYARCTR